MRKELSSFVATAEKERPEDTCQSLDDELSQVADFEYSQLKEELQIGGIYIRIFNRMGSGREAIREIPYPAMLAKQITDFIARSINASSDLPDGWVALPLSFDSSQGGETATFLKDEAAKVAEVRGSKFLMAIKALLQLVRVDGVIDDVLCEESSSAVPSVLVSLLELPQDSEVKILLDMFLFLHYVAPHSFA